ncbi:sugar ABC transporter substrate-binding protein [Pararhizobium sp.]|uniref:sugar ABC transporter substrate-binding protein n=1 Tax=Pararhizobium sp. TaxID=1977563 RepID=UPI00271E8748|nr:sugar ABC transporter substrate-binding protein [Pararhizobium sp.]MDO9415492.1 sugar ABC transporter substrate-binding protein [Pararhizobium sp.]
MNGFIIDRRSLLLGALGAGMALPAAFAASNALAQSAPLTVGFTIWDLSIPFAVPLVASIKEAAAANNVTLKIVDAKWDASTQAQQIAEFVVQKVDVICATPVDVRGILPAARAAKEAGVPLIACGGVVEGFPYIGADDMQFGIKMGQLIEQALSASGQPGPYNIAFLRGAPGGAPDRLRREGIMSVIGKREDIKIAAEVVTEWSPEKGLSGTQDLLQKFAKGTLHLIHGWGGMVEVPAARYAHTTAGREEIIFTGGELTVQTKEAIDKGWEYGVIIQDPSTLGSVIVSALPKMAPDFKTVPNGTEVPLPICTKANLAEFKPF